ncbi:hypothetical protein THRCLA_08125 [Thraustotheca clavata]|uniref:BTB domain-containing protein n=1 Tax=Thraustotheca clavata TaxID=74557 RepID=A0A1V9Z9I2_9STRA|nr:hypothetical protein THRCLA_08125 [Thraustotheca clavata]
MEEAKDSHRIRMYMRWEDTPIGGATPTIKNHTATLVGSRIFVFGGYDGRRNHNDLHVFDCEKLEWEANAYELPNRLSFTDEDAQDKVIQRNRSQSGPFQRSYIPAGRNGHTATLAEGCIYVIGGWLGSGPLAANDVHILHVDSMRWEEPVTKGVPPGPCNMHTADYIPHLRGIIVFRGGNGREYLNDLHFLGIDTLTWSKCTAEGSAPEPRANHSSAVIGKKLYIFGGWNGRKRLNDLHVLDMSTSVWSWSQVVLQGDHIPHPRAGMTFTCVRDKIYLFGGSGPSAAPAKCFNDLFIFDPQHNKWIDTVVQADKSTVVAACAMDNGANPNDDPNEAQVVVIGDGPSRRAGHTSVVYQRKMFIFSGSYGSEYLNDFFILDTDPTPSAIVTLSFEIQKSLRHFCNRPDFSDIAFIVEGQVVYGHKVILSLMSERFRAMFSAGFLEASAKEIVIPDIRLDIFQWMMEYLYTGTFNMSHIDSVESALELLIAADEYMLDHLKQICETKVQSMISHDTVHIILQAAEEANAPQLRAICLHFVRNSSFD